jgi:hypothetical protein
VTVADADGKDEPSLVERWLQEQAQWQRTMLGYLDSLTKDDEFLVHLGNAMRGSLLAGKPYPTPPASGTASPETPPDDRLDRILFALHELQGRVQDLAMSLDELRGARQAAAGANASAAAKRAKPARKRTAPTRASAKTRERKVRR